MKIAIVQIGYNRITVPVARLSQFLDILDTSVIVDSHYSRSGTHYQIQENAQLECMIVEDTRVVTPTKMNEIRAADAEAEAEKALKAPD